MQVLITGGAGFIGSHLCDRFIERGETVVCVDDLSSGRRGNIAHLEGLDGFRFVDHDVAEPGLEVSPDLVLHFASRASPPDYQANRIHTLRTNSAGTMNLVELAAEHDARLVYASTSEVYGDPEVHPQPESYRWNVSCTGPRACYDEGKRYGEALITSYARQHGLDYTILRIFNTYGPRMKPGDGRVVSNFITQSLRNDPITVYGDGSQTRSFCFVDDLVDGIVTAATREGTAGEVYNIGNPDEHTVLELAEQVQSLVSTSSEIVHEELPEDDPERRRPAITKITGETDWEPETPLETGLKETITYFEEEL